LAIEAAGDRQSHAGGGNKSAWTQPRRLVVLMGQLLVIQCVTLSMSPATAGEHTLVCNELLMENECAQYQQRLESASTDGERDRIMREYHKLIDARRHVCRYPSVIDLERLRAIFPQLSMTNR
jgi:hypothetical protein